MTSLLFYTTLGCHLCEQALEIVLQAMPSECELTQVEISESDQLIQRYGTRIPVVARNDNNNELGWPFDTPAFLTFLK